MAYLDPGSGSLILQVLLGGAAGAIVGIKMFGRRIASALRLRKRDRTEPDPVTGSVEDS